MTQVRVILDEKYMQGTQYAPTLVKVYPPAGTYLNYITRVGQTNDAAPDSVLDGIMKRYVKAWKTLSKL